MSDSDDDFMPNDFEFINGTTGTSDRAPSLFLTNGALRNNINASKYNMQNKYMSYGQQGMYSRRDTSPMSLRSLPSSRMHFQNSYYQRELNSQGSVNNKRCRSPMSVRSIGSNASAYAANILLDLNHSSLSVNDLRMIKNACNKLLGSQSRRKIGKRRNFKSIIKCYSRKSGGDSGDEGSESSRSSDDCRSTRSTLFKENHPLRKTRPLLTNTNKYTTQTSVNDIYEDRSENFKRNSLRNLIIANNRPDQHRSMHFDRQGYVTHNRYTSTHQKITDRDIHTYDTISKINENEQMINPQPTVNDKIQNESVVTLKDRFTESSFLLPSQRFNRPVANSTTYEVSFKEKSKKNLPKTSDKNNKGNDKYEEKSQSNNRTQSAKTRYESDSENYEIFSQNRVIENTIHSKMMHKRIIETEDLTYPERKRNKLTISPQLQNQTASSKMIKLNNKDDYNFKKPQLPKKCNLVKKSLNADSEILIAKSSQPLIEVVSQKLKNIPQMSINLEETYNRQGTNKLSQTATDTVNDVSMSETIENSSTMSKPSFIKRKLFTQDLEIVDNKNSSDHLYGNTPQLKTLRACREKNKVRKLVSSQSCLSHDVAGDNNVIDLIHKIVPRDQINVTSASNKQEAFKSTNEDEDKWDVMSILSRSKIDDASDTYSDEEIFNAHLGNEKNTNGHKDNTKEVGKLKHGITKDSSGTQETKESISDHSKPVSQCKVVINKLSDIEVHEQRKPKKVYPIKSFWDTDLSEVDDNVDSTLKMRSQKEQRQKKIRLVKSFWDTDSSEVEDHSESIKEKVQEEQTRRHSLRNTTMLSNYNRTPNLNSKNSINSNTRGRTSSERENISNRIDRSKSKRKEILVDPHIQYPKNGKINAKRVCRSQSKTKEILVDPLIQYTKNGKINAKRVIKEKSQKDQAKPSSIKGKKQEESPNNLNSSRHSVRISQKNKNNASALIPDKKSSDNCNRSRESVRLKEKRERSIQILNGKT